MGGVKNAQGAGRVTGKEASDLLEASGIIVNKNAIPFDMRPPTDPSGIRVGSPAETTRGKIEKDFIAIAAKIDTILKKIDAKSRPKYRRCIRTIMESFARWLCLYL